MINQSNHRQELNKANADIINVVLEKAVLEGGSVRTLCTTEFCDSLDERAKETIYKLALVNGIYRAMEQVWLWFDVAQSHRFKK